MVNDNKSYVKFHIQRYRETVFFHVPNSYLSPLQALDEAFPWLPIIGGCVGFVVVVALIITIVLICRRYIFRFSYIFSVN